MKKIGLLLLSGFLGYIFSHLLMVHVLTPTFDRFHGQETFKFEYVLLQFVLTVSFLSSVFFLFSKQKKKFFVFGLTFPLTFTALHFCENSPTHHHAYADFWILFLCCLTIAVLVNMLLMSILDFFDGFKEETGVVSASKEEKLSNRIETFVAKEEIMRLVYTVTEQIRKVKSLHPVQVENLHEAEKMEKRLIESQRIFMAIEATHQEEAETLFETLLGKMTSDLQQILEAHNKEQLVALERIVLQQEQH